MINEKIYLAGRYSRRLELLHHKQYIEEQLLCTVTSRWLLGNHQAENDDLFPGGAAERFAQEDLEDLKQANIFMLFTEPPRTGKVSRGGAHVEYGYALAAGKQIVIVGPRSNVFHCLGSVHRFDDFEGAAHYLYSSW